MNSLVSALTCIALLIPSLAASQAPEIATTVAFTEGPTVDRDGNVYFTEHGVPAHHEAQRRRAC